LLSFILKAALGDFNPMSRLKPLLREMKAIIHNSNPESLNRHWFSGSKPQVPQILGPVLQPALLGPQDNIATLHKSIAHEQLKLAGNRVEGDSEHSEEEVERQLTGDMGLDEDGDTLMADGAGDVETQTSSARLLSTAAILQFPREEYCLRLLSTSSSCDSTPFRYATCQRSDTLYTSQAPETESGDEGGEPEDTTTEAENDASPLSAEDALHHVLAELKAADELTAVAQNTLKRAMNTTTGAGVMTGTARTLAEGAFEASGKAESSLKAAMKMAEKALGAISRSEAAGELEGPLARTQVNARA
jgi:hypothetical protein